MYNTDMRFMGSLASVKYVQHKHAFHGLMCGGNQTKFAQLYIYIYGNLI